MEKDSDQSSRVLANSKRKFPKIVYLIILTELCERFSYSGMRAFLALYLKEKLGFSDDGATELYHIFTTMAYFFPIFGAIIADSFLGKYKTILTMMFVYALGNAFVTIASMPLNLPPRLITILGLMLIAIGTGGIKPCVAAFGGDQFILPDQEKELGFFFVYYYFVICLGSLAAKAISPVLRAEIQCFGDKNCNAVAFGAPGILMVFSIVMFIAAKRFYLIKKPSGNVIMKIWTCIYTALVHKVRNKSAEKCHWLDASAHLYGREFLKEMRIAFSVLKLFITLPFFWALLDQLGSRWTLQASRMDGDFSVFTMRPDQISLINPIIILLAIPLLQQVLFPLLAKFNFLVNPFHRIATGIFFIILSFISSGCVEIMLQKTQPVLALKGTGQVRIFNTFHCDLHFQKHGGKFTLKPLEFHTDYVSHLNGSQSIALQVSSECDQSNGSYSILTQEKMALSYVFGGTTIPVLMEKYNDTFSKSRSGYPTIRFITNFEHDDHTVILFNERRNEIELSLNSTAVSNLYEAYASSYSLYLDGRLIISDIKLRVGGVYALAITNDASNKTGAKLVVVTAPNSMTMAWLLPQLFLSSLGEVFVVINSQEFAFREAPQSMKALMQAGLLMSEAIGNVIIIIGTRLAADINQATQSFAYAAVTTCAMITFCFMSRSFEKSKKKDRRLSIGEDGLFVEKEPLKQEKSTP